MPEAFSGKPQARAWARSLLRSLSPAERGSLSAAASARVEALDAFRDCDILLAFLSMPSEIDTSAVVRAAFRLGKRVAAPRMEGGDIAFALLDEAWETLPRDSGGIPTPTEGKGIAPDELAGLRVFVLVPGLLFDPAGGRLGRGKGYYDRFLEGMLAAVSSRQPHPGGGGFFVPCGFCFESQVVAEVPMGEGDIRVPIVATDAGVRRVGTS